MPRRIGLLVAGILAAIAVVLLVICGVIVINTRAFLADSQQATGTVTALIPRQSCSEDSDHRRSCTTVYAPRVRFSTAEGRVVEFTSSTASSPPGYAEGDPVGVRYRPGNPSDARLDTVTGTWLGAIIVGGIGFFFAAFAVLWLVIARRSSRTPAPDPEPAFTDEEWDQEPDQVEPEQDRNPSNPFL